MPRDYRTPGAFRQALEARLRACAEEEGLDLMWLRRQVAFDRLLARVFHQPGSVWLLKGGYAMDLRLQERTRTTLDVDLMLTDTEALRLIADASPGEQTRDIAYDHLQELAGIDLGDCFQYLIAAPKPITVAPEGGMRCAVNCRIAGRTFVRFHLDIGLGDVVLGEPEWVTGRELLAFAGITATRIPLLPAAQQMAEKFHAYTYPWEERTNTRVKDLVDLVLLFETQGLDESELQKAIWATFDRRSTHPLPERLPSPPEEWAGAFGALAGVLGLPVGTLGDAFDYIQDRWITWKLGSRPT
jgi:hypothetical protein